MAAHVLYSASTPIEGAATRARFQAGKQERGDVPYFVSGPLSRKGYCIGLVGTLLHVMAWLLAVIFDLVVGSTINQDQSPGAFTYWMWGYLSLLIGFIALVSTTIYHYFATPQNKFPEGGAPPFLMSLFIGGAQISLILTVLQMIASSEGLGDFFAYPNGTVTATEMKDYRNTQRNLMVWSMIAKCYVVQFLRNNQEWAGPADAIKENL
jgi:hypothetical protein